MGVNVLTRDEPMEGVGASHLPPTFSNSQISKKVGEKLARQQEGWPQYFL